MRERDERVRETERRSAKAPTNLQLKPPGKKAPKALSSDR